MTILGYLTAIIQLSELAAIGVVLALFGYAGARLIEAFARLDRREESD